LNFAGISCRCEGKELEDPHESWVESVRWNMMSKSPAGSKLTKPIKAVENHIIQQKSSDWISNHDGKAEP
jgi:hypothetical protein